MTSTQPTQRFFLTRSSRPFDQRSVLLFCYNCFQPGHRRQGCRNDTRCGQCAGFHDLRNCRKRSVQCPNCGQGHQAWSLDCKDPAVLKMRKTCTSWRERGPRWAPRPQHGAISGIDDCRMLNMVKAASSSQNKSRKGTKTGVNGNSQKRKDIGSQQWLNKQLKASGGTAASARNPQKQSIPGSGAPNSPPSASHDPDESMQSDGNNAGSSHVTDIAPVQNVCPYNLRKRKISKTDIDDGLVRRQPKSPKPRQEEDEWEDMPSGLFSWLVGILKALLSSLSIQFKRQC